MFQSLRTAATAAQLGASLALDFIGGPARQQSQVRSLESCRHGYPCTEQICAQDPSRVIRRLDQRGLTANP